MEFLYNLHHGKYVFNLQYSQSYYIYVYILCVCDFQILSAFTKTHLLCLHCLASFVCCHGGKFPF